MNSLVSVIIPVYNGGLYLKDCIESILNQTYRNIEVIIIDDGSTDCSLDIMLHYQQIDSRVVVISRENKGLIFSLNEAISVAKGILIARMDSDDIAHLDRITKQVNFMDGNVEVDLLGLQAIKIDKDGIEIGRLKRPTGSKAINTFSLINSPVIHPGVMIRSSVLKAGFYNFNDLYVEDYAAWLRLNKGYNIANLDETLLSYRVHEESISQSKKTEQYLNSCLIREKYFNNDIFNFGDDLEKISKQIPTLYVMFRFFLRNIYNLDIIQYFKYVLLVMKKR
ncbi:glycosyltransferase [Vibrio hepatarius]|uniref:glycosyltransferase n=1 Tax=Vibrio hepatarius TaxID=171383 RepID=UPI001C099140|nr:glycosyltransferase [Vibrio hepatarius]MBU2896910.1 glycosyltransferase [Vibrio hepatarius]